MLCYSAWPHSMYLCIVHAAHAAVKSDSGRGMLRPYTRTPCGLTDNEIAVVECAFAPTTIVR
jgi:hypothetical protein